MPGYWCVKMRLVQLLRREPRLQRFDIYACRGPLPKLRREVTWRSHWSYQGPTLSGSKADPASPRISSSVPSREGKGPTRSDSVQSRLRFLKGHSPSTIQGQGVLHKRKRQNSRPVRQRQEHGGRYRLLGEQTRLPVPTSPQGKETPGDSLPDEAQIKLEDIDPTLLEDHDFLMCSPSVFCFTRGGKAFCTSSLSMEAIYC